MDLDDVLAGFVPRMFEQFNHKTGWKNHAGFTDLAKVLGVTTKEMWEKIEGNRGFWANLPLLPGHLVMSWLRRHLAETDIYFLTSPSRCPMSYAGKVDWVMKHYPSYIRRLILTSQKHLLARPDCLLIDDRKSNCGKFMVHGGRAVLYPQPWNGEMEDIDGAKSASEVIRTLDSSYSFGGSGTNEQRWIDFFNGG